MDIMRKGAARDDGLSFITISSDKINWDEGGDCLKIICDQPVWNFNGGARHKYIVKISLEELADYIKLVGESCKLIDKDKFISAFEYSLASLKKIEARASGIY